MSSATTSLALEPITLATGVTLDVALAGDRTNSPIIMLHGFPESHRTWHAQIEEFRSDHFVIAPDQRGYARSSKPESVSDYATGRLVDDLFALADHLAIERFTLLAHDWGGAVAWMAAIKQPQRIANFIAINAPHPFLFQKALFRDPVQRESSQYIRGYRDPGCEADLLRSGLEAFFDRTFAEHGDLARIMPERPAYLAEWREPGALTGMLNWYRATRLIVPRIGEVVEEPDYFASGFPPLLVPTLIVWGMRDTALRPMLLDGLDALVPDLTVRRIDAGHFASWEEPEAVNAAIREWLARS